MFCILYLEYVKWSRVVKGWGGGVRGDPWWKHEEPNYILKENLEDISREIRIRQSKRETV